MLNSLVLIWVANKEDIRIIHQRKNITDCVYLLQYDSPGTSEHWPQFQTDSATRRRWQITWQEEVGHYFWFAFTVCSSLSHYSWVKLCEPCLFVLQVCQCDQSAAGPFWILHGAFLRWLSKPTNQPGHVRHQEWNQVGPQ